MKIHPCAQGSTAWLKLRLGIPTASNFDRIITPGGKPSSSQDGYLRELLAEIIIGQPLEQASMPWMERGNMLEAQAVKYYEFENDVETIPVGFITTDDGRYGASPDRLIGDRGLLEVKCPAPQTHVGYLLFNDASGKYKPQLQGQLLVAEREFNDIVSYHPDMPNALVRVTRDEPFIKALGLELAAFCERLAAKVEVIRERGWLKTEAPAPKEWLTEADAEAILAEFRARDVEQRA